MAMPLAVVVLLCVHRRFFEKSVKQAAMAFMGVVLLLNTVIYILRSRGFSAVP